MQPIPLIRQVVMVPAISYLVGEGVAVDRYLRLAKLSAPTPETLESLVPLYQLCDFLSLVAREQGLDDLGFRIAGQLGIENLGSFGRLVSEAFTFHESIQISRELISSYNSGQLIWMERYGDQVRYCQKCVGHLPQDRIREIVHLGLANALSVARVNRGTDWRPTRMELATDPIDVGAIAPELNDIPVDFNQPQTSLWFDHTWLSKPLPAIESSHLTRADENERASFRGTGPSRELVGQLEQAIESALGRPGIGLELTAAIIGFSPRTLQRRLAEQDLSYSRLLQSVRFQTAQRLLRDRRMPLKEIAGRLSYADLANFIRAFKRWTGVGPNEFRRLHYGDEGR